MRDASKIRYSVGIDVGASKVRIGLLDSRGTVLGKRTADIREKKASSAETLRFIVGEVRAVVEAAGLVPGDVGFLGMGIPGTVDDAGKRIAFAPNLGWRDVSIGEHFRSLPDAGVTLVQDGRAAAFGEYLLGAGRGESTLVCITLGTGIGAGIIIDGKVFHGGSNTAGEIGHTIVQENGLPCKCGQSGCLEAYCSGTAIVTAARLSGKCNGGREIRRAEEVFACAAAGDAEAGAVISRAAHYLGVGIVNVVNTLSPNAVILSGGMCGQEELLIRPVREFVQEHGYPLCVRNPAFRLVKAELGEDSPMIGAAMLYRGE